MEAAAIRHRFALPDDVERVERCIISLEKLDQLDRHLASLEPLLVAARHTIEQAKNDCAAVGITARGLHGRLSTVGSATPLTDRECRIALMIVAGYTNERIAGSLHVSVHTVKTHLKSLFVKLDVRSRWEVRHALEIQGGDLVGGGSPTLS